jgi:hypothetical protein
MYIFVDEATNKVCVQLTTAKSKSQFAEAVKAVNTFYAKYGHTPVKVIYSDNESAVVAFEPEFNSQGGEIIFKAPGQHVGLAEVYIRIFKEILRTLLLQLEFTWPPEFFEDLVYEVVQLMDLRGNDKTGGVPVGEVVKGIRPDYQYMQHSLGTWGLATNTRPELKKDEAPRATYGIILRRPYNNEMRYKILPLDQSVPNAQPFFCKKFQELPMPQEIIDRLNSMSSPSLTPDNYFESIVREVDVEANPNLMNAEQIRRLARDNPDAFDAMPPVGVPQQPSTTPEPSYDPTSSGDYEQEPPDPIPDTFEAGPEPSAPDPIASPSPSPVKKRYVFKRVDPALRDAAPDPNLGRGKRHQKTDALQALAAELFESELDYEEVSKIFENAYIAKVGGNMSYKKASEKHGDIAFDAGEKEISGMLAKDIFEPVYWDSLSQDMKDKTIRSFTFYKEKFKVDGSLDKLKARMVAQGQLVDKSTLGDISAPTPGLEAIFLMHALAAQLGYRVAVMDIPSAFLHSQLPEDQRLPMIISKDETAIIVKLKPEWSKYVRRDGTLVVMVIGSLYGLPQAPQIFNADLSAAMFSLGYRQCAGDACIFVRYGENDDRSIVAVHVDDLLHIYNSDQFQTELFEMISKKFSVPTVSIDNEGIHLGIEFLYDREDRSVRLTMYKYIQKLLQDFRITSGASTPTTADFMTVDESSPPYDQRDYASRLMSLYYLAARVRKDILFPLTFLASRIHDCRVADAQKLDRVFRFVYATQSRGIVLRTRGTRLVFSIDASYAIHPNSRSHSGLYVTLGGVPTSTPFAGGPVWCRSIIQRLVSYSSYEAEITSLHQSRDLIIYLRELLSDFGFDQDEPSLVLEDNMASISAINQGERFRGRATHVNVRVHGFAQLIEAGAVEIVYCPTEIMLADGLTKPFFTRSHLPLLFRLLNDYGYLFDDIYDTAASTSPYNSDDDAEF